MQPQQTGDSGGKGLVIAIGIVLMIAGASYFAYVKNVDFPGSSIVRNVTGAAVDTYNESEQRQSPRRQGPTPTSPAHQLHPTSPPVHSVAATYVPSTEVLLRALSTPAVVITRVEPTVPDRTDLNKLRNANWIRSAHRDTYDRITAFPWVQDGLSHEEGRTVENLFFIAAGDHSNLKELLDLNWLGDGPTAAEAKAVQWLRALNHLNRNQMSVLLQMPFIKSVTETDALLVEGLFSRQYRRAPGNILNYPKARDGITDDDTTLLTAATTSNDEGQLRRLLTPGGATVETIQTATARTPNLKLSIVRAGDRKVTDTTKILEEAITYVEETMDMPLPTNHVILLLDDSGVYENFAGVNYGQAMAVRRKSEDGTDWDRQAFRAIMVHEVAHYFWHGSEDWIDEGVANAIDITYAREKNPSAEFKRNEREGCTLNTLEELARAERHRNSTAFRCNYYLGGNLFL